MVLSMRTIGSGVFGTVGRGYLSIGEANEVMQGLSDESDHLRSFVVASVGVVDLGEEIYASVGEPFAALCIGHVFEKAHEASFVDRGPAAFWFGCDGDRLVVLWCFLVVFRLDCTIEVGQVEEDGCVISSFRFGCCGRG